MNPILSIIIDKLAFVAIVGGLAALPMVFLVGWRGWLGMACLIPACAVIAAISTVI
jgi:hypothetical protein